MATAAQSRGLRTFSVVLDNPSKSYFVGQEVKGRLILDLDRQIKTNAVMLNFTGRAAVKWQEYESIAHHKAHAHRRPKTHKRRERLTFWDREVYFNEDKYVWGEGGGPERSLGPGYQEFPISFQLPVEIPSSYVGPRGNIQYTVAALIKQGSEFDQTVTAITVNGLVDLNTIKIADVPIELQQEKFIGCFCCKDGPISFKFKLRKTGFVPGEPLAFTVEMNNQSKKDVKWCEVRLCRRDVFRAMSVERSNYVTIMTFHGPGVGAHSTEVWRISERDCIIPPIPPTYLRGCNLIWMRYSIEVQMQLPACCHINLEQSTEIVIGTIPFRNTFAQIHPDSTDPSIPIPGFSDLPCPAYQDVCNGDIKGVMVVPQKFEDDAVIYDSTYVIKYPTYKWK